MNNTKKYLIIIVLMIASVLLLAHPHIFVSIDSRIVFTDTDLEKIHFKWVFDDMTSFGILEEFDKNSDDNIDGEELQETQSVFVENQSDKNFYVHLFINDSLRTINKIDNFSTYFDGMYMNYEFDVMLNIPLNALNQDVRLLLYDEDNYVKIMLHKDKAVEVVKPDTADITFERFFNKEISYYYGQLNPEEIKIKISKE